VGFHDKLRESWRRSGSLLCVGLDPDPRRVPQPLRGDMEWLLQFCIEIVDATAPFTSAFKPQIAHFAAQSGERALERLCAHIRARHPHHVLILDAKRGDIGSTAEHYAAEAFERYGADAVTVNPYLGGDAVEPFLRHEGKGVIVLCRTSNPGGSDLQNLVVGEDPLYLHVARLVKRWNDAGECGLVVGATFPDELAAVRAVVDDLPILVPGIGAQGGDVAATLLAGQTADGTGLVISSSRAILYASEGDDFAAAAARAADATRREIDAARAAFG
jgi:orotidine-5'-phosphate decarboxylase